jgi:CRISPR-associated protein (TIGR02710 family)
MTGSPKTAPLSAELRAVQERWRSLPREEQDALYAKEFAEPFARLFADLPLHGAPPDMARPRALVSILGFSWQPGVLMAAWCRPERMLVLGTDKSLEAAPSGEGVLSLVARIAGVSRGVIEQLRVDDPGEVEIYRAVRDFVHKAGFNPREIFIDPTGGKKSMSSSAALAGYLLGTPLVYVDHTEYHGPNRIPVPGTEYPRLLTNPLEVFGDLELRDIFAAFNRGDFREAGHLAVKMAQRLYAPREAECLAQLAKGYAAWDLFDFRAAHEALIAARSALGRFVEQGRWAWAPTANACLTLNLPVLDALTKVQRKPGRIEEGLPLVVWYLAAARRRLATDKPSLALLLTYAAIERYVDLCLWVDFGLDDERPDYSRVLPRLDRARYEEAGRRLFGDGYRARDPEGMLMFSNGAQLLAAVAPNRLELDDLGPLKGLSVARNKCEYEHGFLPQVPSTNEVSRYLNKAIEIVSRSCGGHEALAQDMERYRFPILATTEPLSS